MTPSGLKTPTINLSSDVSLPVCSGTGTQMALESVNASETRVTNVFTTTPPYGKKGRQSRQGYADDSAGVQVEITVVFDSDHGDLFGSTTQ
jgi:hypothetical protein